MVTCAAPLGGAGEIFPLGAPWTKKYVSSHSERSIIHQTAGSPGERTRKERKRQSNCLQLRVSAVKAVSGTNLVIVWWKHRQSLSALIRGTDRASVLLSAIDVHAVPSDGRRWRRRHLARLGSPRLTDCPATGEKMGMLIRRRGCSRDGSSDRVGRHGREEVGALAGGDCDMLTMVVGWEEERGGGKVNQLRGAASCAGCPGRVAAGEERGWSLIAVDRGHVDEVALLLLALTSSTAKEEEGADRYGKSNHAHNRSHDRIDSARRGGGGSLAGVSPVLSRARCSRTHGADFLVEDDDALLPDADGSDAVLESFPAELTCAGDGIGKRGA